MGTISFKRHRFSPEIIRRAVWLYARFALSYRDVEDLLAERGLDISHESVRRWFLKFGAPIARNLRHTRPIPNGYWHLDERVIVIRGQRYWLWRGVDNEGEVLDFLVQSKRNAQAALKLMRKLLKKQGWPPTRITPVAQRVRRAPVGPGQEVEGVGEGEYPVEEAGGGSVFGQADPEGSVLGKLLGPANRRRAVMWVRERLGAERVSERRACQVLGSIDPAKGKANSR